MWILVCVIRFLFGMCYVMCPYVCGWKEGVNKSMSESFNKVSYAWLTPNANDELMKWITLFYYNFELVFVFVFLAIVFISNNNIVFC